MRGMITAALSTALLFGAAGCDDDAEEAAEERVDEQTEADGTETLGEEIQEIGAGEVADFEDDQEEGHPIADEFREEVAEDDDTTTEAALEESP